MIERTLIRDIVRLPVQDSTVLMLEIQNLKIYVLYYSIKNIRYNQLRIHTDYDEKSFFTDKNIIESIERANRIIFTNTWRRENLNNGRDVVEKFQVTKKFNVKHCKF